MIDFENSDFLKLRAVDNGSFAGALEPMLTPGEEIVASFKTVRDGVVFTTKRIIAINVQGLTGRKTDFTSLPYNRIQAFSVETAGVLDLDGELQIWLGSLGKVRFEFTAGSDLARIGAIVAQGTL